LATTRTPADTGLQLGIIIFTLATAIFHFSLVPAFPNPFAVPFPLVFMLNGIGYLVLLGALYLPIPQLEEYRNVIRILLIAYTVLTVVLWIFLGARTTEGYIDKLIEVVLIVLLAVEARSARGG
jgi:hypothetical protein